MMRSDERFPSGHRLVAVAVLMLLAAGCAGVGDGGGERNASRVAAARHAPKIEHDGAHGFTVSEVVRVGSDVRSDYQRAMALLQRGELAAGVAMLESVVERAPELAIPHIDLGVAHRRLGNLESAQQSLEKALDLAPDHPAALNELGIVYRHLGRFSEARGSYEKALAVHAGYHFALLNLGVLCDLYLQDLDCALSSYRQYADVVTDDDEVRMWIADIESRLSAAH